MVNISWLSYRSSGQLLSFCSDPSLLMISVICPDAPPPPYFYSICEKRGEVVGGGGAILHENSSLFQEMDFFSSPTENP